MNTPTIIMAIACDADFLRMIDNSTFAGVVHSVFERTCNILRDANGELYTIATSTVDEAPNTLILPIPNIRCIDVHVGDRLRAQNGLLRLDNGMAIAVNRAAVWRCRLPSFPMDVAPLRRNTIAVQACIDHDGTESGITAVVQAFLHACKQHPDDASSYAKKLIGLGPGLTPAGDDFLVGFMTMCVLPQSPLHAYISLCEEIVNTSTSYTNAISTTAFKKAIQGQVRKSLCRFIEAMFVEASEGAVAQVRTVLEIGATSGTELARGIVAGARLSLEMIGD